MKLLKLKIISLIAMVCLVLGLLVVGIYAAEIQYMKLYGYVDFNIGDKNLYIQDVRLSDSDGTEIYSFKEKGKFVAGYVNNEFSLNLGECINTSGSLILSLDVINVIVDETSNSYRTTIRTLQDGVNISMNDIGFVPSGSLTSSEITANSTPTATIIMNITSSENLNINLNEIVFTFTEYTPVVIENFSFNDSGTLINYNGTESDLVVPTTYSIIRGIPEPVTLEFNTYSDFLDYITNNTSVNYIQNFDVIVDGEFYSFYEDFLQFSSDADVVSALQNATESIEIKYEESNNIFVEGNDIYVTEIGPNAFLNNTYLQRLTIPYSVTHIRSDAFDFCSSLVSIVFEDGSQLQVIEDFAFLYCSSLTSITIPTSVTSIGETMTFSGCSSLTTVTIESETIYNNATSSTAYGDLLRYATTIRVLADFVSDSHSYINTTNFLYTSDEVVGAKTYRVYSTEPLV